MPEVYVKDVAGIAQHNISAMSVSDSCRISVVKVVRNLSRLSILTGPNLFILLWPRVSGAGPKKKIYFSFLKGTCVSARV